VTALYEVIPVGVETHYAIGGVDSLRYQIPAPRRLSDTGELLFVKLRYKAPDGDTSRLLTQPVEDVVRDPSQDLRFASAVAGFGMLLRESEFSGTWTMAHVLNAARQATADDDDQYRAEFVELVEAVVRSELLAAR
jgi:Ca-activated chloride channel family protein